MKARFRSIANLFDAVGHIGSAVRAAQEFERSRVSHHPAVCTAAEEERAAAGIPL